MPIKTTANNRATRSQKTSQNPAHRRAGENRPILPPPPQGPQKYTQKQRQRFNKHKYNEVNIQDNSKCTHHNCIVCIDNYITNISSTLLSLAEKSLLSKGLTFIPTAPDLSQHELLSSFDDFVKEHLPIPRETHDRDNRQNRLNFP